MGERGLAYLAVTSLTIVAADPAGGHAEQAVADRLSRRASVTSSAATATTASSAATSAAASPAPVVRLADFSRVTIAPGTVVVQRAAHLARGHTPTLESARLPAAQFPHQVDRGSFLPFTAQDFARFAGGRAGAGLSDLNTRRESASEIGSREVVAVRGNM